MNTRTVLTAAICIALIISFGLFLVVSLFGMETNLSDILVPRFFGST